MGSHAANIIRVVLGALLLGNATLFSDIAAKAQGYAGPEVTTDLEFFRAGPQHDGFAWASVKVAYRFVECGDAIHVQIRLLPATFRAGRAYWLGGVPHDLPASFVAETPSRVAFRSALVNVQSKLVHLEGIATPSPSPACAIESSRVARFDEFRHSMQSWNWRQEIINRATIDVAMSEAALRDYNAEAIVRGLPRPVAQPSRSDGEQRRITEFAPATICLPTASGAMRQECQSGTTAAELLRRGNERAAAGDMRAAIEWWRLATGHGSELAKLLLARAHINGDGVPVDRVEGLRWLRMAADEGSEDARRLLREMDGREQNHPNRVENHPNRVQDQPNRGNSAPTGPPPGGVSPRPADGYSWDLIGVRVPELNSGCGNNPLTRAGWFYVRRDANRQAQRDQLSRTLDSEPSYRYWRGITHHVRPGSPAVVALVRIRWSCSAGSGPRRLFTAYDFVEERNVAAVHAVMQRRQQRFPEEILGFEIFPIDWESEIGALRARGVTSGPGRHIQ
jgi:hypothetical protein